MNKLLTLVAALLALSPLTAAGHPCLGSNMKTPMQVAACMEEHGDKEIHEKFKKAVSDDEVILDVTVYDVNGNVVSRVKGKAR